MLENIKIYFSEDSDEYELYMAQKESRGDVLVEYEEKLYKIEFLCRADSSFCIEKTDVSYYSYKIQGKFIGNKMVKIGEINIFVDGYIPADIQIDEFISFYCMRIDLMVNSL